MSTMTEKRRLEFITPKRYNQLDKEVKDKLLSYRRLYNRVVRKESLIDNLQKGIRTEKEKLMEMRSDLTSNNHFIDHLRDKYEFSCSIIKLKPRGPYNRVYYNLCISRRGETHPKNVGLGNRETLIKVLLDHFKNNPSVRGKIIKDWEGWLWGDCNDKDGKYRKGSTYQKIEEMIFNNPLGFKNENISRGILFPIKQKKGKTKK